MIESPNTDRRENTQTTRCIDINHAVLVAPLATSVVVMSGAFPGRGDVNLTSTSVPHSTKLDIEHAPDTASQLRD
jgi:hypothetical protein